MSFSLLWLSLQFSTCMIFIAEGVSILENFWGVLHNLEEKKIYIDERVLPTSEDYLFFSIQSQLTDLS